VSLHQNGGSNSDMKFKSSSFVSEADLKYFKVRAGLKIRDTFTKLKK
jgi:hypothetical protein